MAVEVAGAFGSEVEEDEKHKSQLTVPFSVKNVRVTARKARSDSNRQKWATFVRACQALTFTAQH
jgi:hypothetical protein